MPNYLNNPNVTLGIRNNNPGNLRRTSINWNGKIPHELSSDASFEQFYRMEDGVRAMMRDLYNDYKKGKKSVTALISEYAPAFENNTATYIASVIKSIGGDFIPELNESVLLALSRAIVYVENNPDHNLVTAQDYRLAINNLGLPLAKKKV